MTWNPSQLVDVINKNREKQLVVKKIIDTNPQQLPIIPKLIQDKRAKPLQENDPIRINRGILEAIHNRIQTKRRNNKNIIELFPDIELAIQILVSYILSPKKMTDTQLNFKLRKGFETAPAVTSAVLEVIKEYVNEEHDLEDNLADIVREALFNSGAYCLAVIPEAAVDEVINADIIASYSTEEFSKHTERVLRDLTDPIYLKTDSFTAKPTGISSIATAQEWVNHLASNSFVRMTDNVRLLHFNRVKDQIKNRLVEQSARRGKSVSQESLNKIGYLDLFRDRQASNTSSNVTMLKERDETRRKSIGKSMVVRFPTQSVMPGVVPGNEKEHLFYLVLLDEDGKAFNIENSDRQGTGVQSIHATGTANNNTPIQMAYRNLIQQQDSGVDSAQLFNMYRDVMERQIYTAIKGTLYGSNFEITNKEDIYFMMFNRALAGEKTNVLFVPKNQMTYFAFYYDEYGIGESLLDNLNTLSSLRAILLFSSVMAQSKQAIDVTKVGIQLDPNDQDPEKTIAMVQDSVLKLRQNYFPLGINNPVDLVNWIQRAGLQFEYTNNPLLPDIKISFENANLSHTLPDSNLEETLRKQTIQALGLSPEVIDSGFSPQFATTEINNNVLLAKRVAIYQKTLNRHVTNFVSQLTYNDQTLRAKLKQVLQELKSDFESGLTEEQRGEFTKNQEEFTDAYLDSLSKALVIELPRPENTNLTALAQEFEIYRNGLDSVVDSVISSEIFTEDVTGVITNHIDSIKMVYKHHLLRAWCADNNYYPEAMGLSTTSAEEVDALIEVISSHLTSTMRSSSSLLNVMRKYKEATAVDLQRALGDGAGENSFTDTSSGGGDDGSSDENTGAEDGDMSGDDLLSF